MKIHTRISVPNSVLLVMDYAIGMIPETMGGKLIATTDSCIAVGTACENDDLVEVELTDESPEFVECMVSVSKAKIQTPNREVSICTVLDDKFLTIPVKHSYAGIEVWVNHMTEPNKIIIAITD